MDEEKWFRFRALCFSKKTGKMDQQLVVFAPTLSMLADKAAANLSMSGVEPSYTDIDRVLVEIEEGSVKLKEVIMNKVVDGKDFSKKVLSSETYQKLRLEKLEEEDAKSR